MKILIACDKFKGTLTAQEVVQTLAKGIRTLCPAAQIESLVVSDGGEGFLEALQQAQPLQMKRLSVPGPLGKPGPGSLGVCGSGIYIESSQATGFHLIPSSQRNPLHTSSTGLALLLEEALSQQPKTLYIGLGSSSTCDAGLAVARHFGYRFFDDRGQELVGQARDLPAITSYTRPDLQLPRLYGVADLNTPHG